MAQAGDTAITDLVNGAGRRLHVRVLGSNEHTAAGPYQLRMVEIDLDPEDWGAMVRPGDTVLESINSFNDIDEFRVVVPDGFEWMNVFAETVEGETNGGLTISVLGTADTQLAPPTSVPDGDTTVWRYGIGRISVTPTTLTIQVRGATKEVRGRYRLLPELMSEQPELVSNVLVPGDTLIETIEPVGDIDRFVVAGTTSAYHDVVFGLVDGAVDPLELVLETSAGTEEWVGRLSEAGSMTLSSFPILDPPSELVVNADWRSMATYRFRGEYFLVAFEHNPLPEDVAELISVNVDVTGERIFPAGDADTFKFPADSGKHLGLVFNSSSPLDQGYLQALLITRTPSTWAVLQAYSRGGVADSTGVIQLGSTDTMEVSVSAQNPAPLVLGNYQFRVYELSVGPEHVPSGIASGDTVVGESIDAEGDIDEFQMELTAGDEFQVVVSQAEQDPETDGYIGVWVVDPAGNTVTAAAALDHRRAQTDYVLADQSGTYVLRVESGSGLPMYSGGYTISVTPPL